MSDASSLNNRQRAILEYIRTMIKTNGYPPSVREICRAVGLKSSSTVHSYLVQLEEKGYIRKDPSKPRAIIPVDMNNYLNIEALPVIGHVAAGSPILAEENIEDYMPVPMDLMGTGTHFILKVKGESMIEAGILDGDYLIVKQQADAVNGDIVVAMVGEDEATVKRYYKRPDYIELRPENSTMQPIISREVKIVGKVAGLLRRM